MPPARVVLNVGLTGGIASGKSTVDGVFHELGAEVMDADAVVHALLAPGGGAVPAVRAAFGPSVAAADDGIDRAALGAIVFADDPARARLEAIVHPLVSAEIARWIADVRERGAATILIVDAALLVESGIDRRFDRLVVVTCSEQTQVERLRAVRGLGRDEALRRVRAQAPSAAKAARADSVIDNDGPLEATRARVREVHAALERDHALKVRGELAPRGGEPWA